MDHGQIFYLDNSSFDRSSRITGVEVAVQHGIDENQSVAVTFFSSGNILFTLDKRETERLVSKIINLWKGEPLDIK